MKVHTSRPKAGNARRAWDYFTATKGAEPLDMSYSPYSDFDEGPAWVATYPQRARWDCDVGCDPTIPSVPPLLLKRWAENRRPA